MNVRSKLIMINEEQKTLKTGRFSVTRHETGFDKACDQARDIANKLVGIDDCGHSELKGWERFDSHIRIEFIRFVLDGSAYIYDFKYEAIKTIDLDEDEDS